MVLGFTDAGLAETVSLSLALDRLRDDSGRTLRDISDAGPALVVLLRHAGCTFCRQTLADLAVCREKVAATGTSIVVVGMSETTRPLRELGERFGLSEVVWIADPDRLMHRALALKRGGLRELFGPSVMLAGIRGLMRGMGVGRPDGDPFQMPGTAVIHKGLVIRSVRHRTAADRPDYESLVCSLNQP